VTIPAVLGSALARRWLVRDPGRTDIKARAGLATRTAAPPEARRVFPGRDDQVAQARRFVRWALEGCPVIDEAILCMSELATNALLHTASGNGGAFEIAVRRDEWSVRVAITDDGSLRKPIIRKFDMTSEEGRGLGLVALIADSWGQSGDEHGRTVWFELRWGVARIPVRRPADRYA
jgi:anti-sigma regulatory factor (Ser/Thr protein kinase)